MQKFYCTCIIRVFIVGNKTRIICVETAKCRWLLRFGISTRDVRVQTVLLDTYVDFWELLSWMLNTWSVDDWCHFYLRKWSVAGDAICHLLPVFCVFYSRMKCTDVVLKRENLLRFVDCGGAWSQRMEDTPQQMRSWILTMAMEEWSWTSRCGSVSWTLLHQHPQPSPRWDNWQKCLLVEIAWMMPM